MAAEQLTLTFDGDGSGPWTYHFGMPDRSGASYYTHLIWAEKYDPPETMGRGAGVRDPVHWRKARTTTVAAWEGRILELFAADGQPRTFNRICIELTGTHASVWLDEPIDQALWRLVKRRELVWANEEGAVFFLPARFLTSCD